MVKALPSVFKPLLSFQPNKQPLTMPPKKTKKVDKAKDNKPTVKTRAMARAEAAAAAPVAGAIPVVAPVAAPLATPVTAGKRPRKTPAPKPTTGVKRKRKGKGDDSGGDSDSDKPAKGAKRRRKADDDGSSDDISGSSNDGNDSPNDEERMLRGRLDDNLDAIEEALRAVGSGYYKDILLSEHKSTETRRQKRAKDKTIPFDQHVEPLTTKKRKSKNFPDGFVVVTNPELQEMKRVLASLLVDNLAKKRIQHPRCETGTKTLAKQWKKHGLTLRELLDLYNHTGPAVEEPTRSALEKKCKEYGLNTVGATLWDLDKAVTLYELAAKKRLYDLPQGEMEDIVSALWSVQAEAANGKRLDEDQRRNRDNEIMNQEVVTVSSGGQTQQFTRVNVSGVGFRCMWHAIQEIWLGQEQGHGTTFEERYPVHSRVIDLWEEVMHQPDGTTNPARLSRRALYRAMQWDSINARDGSLEDRLYNMQMGDIDMVQLVADALDVEIFTYTPQYESDGTTSWIRLARGQPQTDPQRQIHIANYMHSIHWTALRPVGTFAMPDLDPMATTPNFTLDPPGPVPRLPIGHIENFDLRPEARHDDPEDGHVADCTVRDLADGETEEATEDEYEYEYEDEDMDEEDEEEEGEGEGEGEEEEGKEEQEEDDEEQYEVYEYYDEDGTPSAGGNSGGVPTVVVSHSPSSKSSLWNDRNGGRPLFSPRSPTREQIILKLGSRLCFEVIVGTAYVQIAAKLILGIKPTFCAVQIIREIKSTFCAVQIVVDFRL
ncbi:hypothetical protein D6C82_10261 [Aureobasidium pullulans]|nr:hypothetical protein D6C82_10261 [Aureobasidium pullulans]